MRGYARSQVGLRYQATRDALTGLANRPHLVERVDALIARGETSGGHVDLLFLDLDGFKLVNDSWGHHVGDRVLVAASERLLGITDPSDVIARIGGDEFVLARFVGPGGGSDGQMLAADVIDAFRRPLTVSDTSLVTTVSVGMARSVFPATAEGLLRDADTAMYRAKDGGRNRCIVFDSTMRDSVRARVETELALRHALDRDQLILHYQPIVSIEDGATRGFEALLRWAHPGKGMISPLDFIPVAEETGLIVEIGEWVVSEAVRQLASWRAAGIRPDGHDLFMAVNVSARQLQETALVEHVQAELLRHDVPAHLLVLELTESAMMADPQSSAVLLNRLRDVGRPAGRRRLRHRLLVVEPPSALPRHRGEDRPLVRVRDRAGLGRRGDRPGDRRDVLRHAHAGRRGRHRDARPARPPAPAGRPTGSGLAVRTPGAGGGLRLRDGAQPARMKS